MAMRAQCEGYFWGAQQAIKARDWVKSEEKLRQYGECEEREDLKEFPGWI